MNRPPLPLGARWSGQRALGAISQDAKAAFSAAYAAWRQRIVALVMPYRNQDALWSTFQNNLASFDRARDHILAGHGQEVLPNGLTRVQSLEQGMRGMLAAMSDVIPSTWDLFCQAVVDTANQVKDVATAGAKEASSLVKYASIAATVAALGYIIHSVK